MKKLISAMCLVLVALGCPASAPGQQPASAPAEQAPAVQPPEQAPSVQPSDGQAAVAPQPATAPLNRVAHAEVHGRWAEIRKDIEEKQFDAARTKITELEGRLAAGGITSFEELSASMVKRGEALLDAGEIKGALMLFDSAARISPNYPPPYFARGWGLIKQNKLKFMGAFDSFLEGFINSFDDFWWSFYYTGNKFINLLFALAALFFLFGLTMAIRYTPLLAHDLAELSGKQEKEELIGKAALPLALLLILLAFGYWWAVAVTLLSLWVYFNLKEKAVAVVFFLLLIFMPVIMAKFAGFVRGGGDRMLWVMDEVNKGKFIPETKIYIQNLLAAEPDNEAALACLARIERKEGGYGDAMGIYERLLETRPDSAAYRNNLGNIKFLTGDFEGAVKDYEAAVQLSSANKALYYFNLSQAYSERFMFTESRNADVSATAQDPELVSRLRDVSSAASLVFDEPVAVREFWNRAFSGKDKETAEDFWRTSVKVLPLRGTPAAGVCFLVLAFALGAYRKKRVYSHYCKKCGKISCKKCQRPHYNKELCAQCHQIFVKLDGVEARDRVRKMLEVRDAKEREGLICRAASLVLPGSGHFLLGHPIRGFVFAGAFLFLVKDIFFEDFFHVPYGFHLPIVSPDSIILFAVLALFYLAAQANAHWITRSS